MPSRIPAQRIRLTDLAGLANTAWFLFFENLSKLTGSDSNTITIPDLAIGGVAPLAQGNTEEGVIIANVRAVLNFPSTAANAVSDLTISAPGAVIGDEVTLTVPSISVPAAGGSFFPWVTANTVNVRFVNNTGAAIDPGVGTFRAVVRRY